MPEGLSWQCQFQSLERINPNTIFFNEIDILVQQFQSLFMDVGSDIGDGFMR